MAEVISKLKRNPVILVSIIFTFISMLAPLSDAILFMWIFMWFAVPVFMSTDKALVCDLYMSLYMRTLLNIKLFSIIVFVSFLIILIKKI